MDPDLHAFLHAVRHGGVVAGARALGISQPAMSARLKRLSESAKVPLFSKDGRRLKLTSAGTRLYEGALRVDRACESLEASMRTEAVVDAPLRVGAADGIPKIVVRRVIEPYLRAGYRIECREWRADLLEEEMLAHRLEMLLSDRPLLQAKDELLQTVVEGQSAILLCARKDLAAQVRAEFPASLARLPLALPAAPSVLRERMDRWLARHAPEARIALEAEDRALLHQAAAAGLVVAPVAKTLARTVNAQHGLAQVAELAGVVESYYCIRARGRVPALF